MSTDLSNQSVWDLVTQAGPVVQLVMLALFLASVISWAIIIEKWIRLRRVKRQARNFEEQFWSGGNVAEFFKHAKERWPNSPLPLVFMSGYQEWSRWRERKAKGQLNAEWETGDSMANVRRAMGVVLNREIDLLEQGLPFLATVGSTSPFIGLFGTVWGIMNAFMGLAGVKTTTIAMVAPGIAEALIATAMGLVAAIPAVMAYNKFSSDLRRLTQQMDNFSSEFLNILERRVNRQRGGGA